MCPTNLKNFRAFLIKYADLMPNNCSFRCLLSTMQQHPKRVETIVLAACVLHNLIRIRNPSRICHVADIEDPNTGLVTPGEHGYNYVTVH